MLKFVVLVSCAVAILGAPPVTKTREDIQRFKNYLERAKINNGRPLEEAMAENPEANAWENSGKYQGDILLDDDQIQNLVDYYSGTTSPDRSVIVGPQNRWPNNTLIWEFADGHFTEDQRDQVIAAIQIIENNTCLTFERRTNQTNYIRVTNHQDGCYAHVGYAATRGVHVLNLASNCFNRFVIIHEWLHSVGLRHIHQNYQRDQFITINWENIQQGMQSNFVLHSDTQVTMLGTPYEYASNMHYSPWAFSSIGLRTIVPLYNDNGLMGQRQFVTEWDWARADRAYDCPGAWDGGNHEGELAEKMAQPTEDQAQERNLGENLLAVMDAPQDSVKVVDVFDQ